MNFVLPARLAGLLFLLFAASAQAFVDPPTIYPEHPLAGQPVEVRIRVGECDAFFEGVPGFPKIERTGNAIRLLLRGNHETDPILCNADAYVSATVIGAYPAGHYSLQVDRFYEGLQLPTTETIGDLKFDVAEPVSVVALRSGVESLLGFALVAIVALIFGRKATHFWRHRSSIASASSRSRYCA